MTLKKAIEEYEEYAAVTMTAAGDSARAIAAANDRAMAIFNREMRG